VTFAPIAPTTSVAPTKIAPDTYVTHQVAARPRARDMLGQEVDR
jgi:hypothetical protein